MKAQGLAGPVVLRPVCAEDEEFLRALDGAVLTEQLGLQELDPGIRATLLEIQFAARRHDRATRFPGADQRLIVQGDLPVGMIVVDRSAERLQLVDLALAPQARGQGIASGLLEALSREADQRQLALRATTQSTNAVARRLYAGAGLRELEDDGLNVHLERPPLAKP